MKNWKTGKRIAEMLSSTHGTVNVVMSQQLWLSAIDLNKKGVSTVNHRPGRSSWGSIPSC